MGINRRVFNFLREKKLPIVSYAAKRPNKTE